jgi:hypothetical protein
MLVLRIEHPVPSFEGWKEVFDSDPADRQESGVLRYSVSRPVDDPDYVSVDLEFTTRGEADAFLGRLRELWAGTGARVSADQQARILETVESREYRS